MAKNLITATIVCLSLTLGSCFSPKEVNDLKKQLMQQYDKTTNPVSNTSADIEVAFRIASIGDLDETSEKLTTVMLITAKWKDEFFQWNHTLNGVENISADPETVWVPELKILNQHYDKRHDATDRLRMPVLYTPSGYAFFMEMVTAETTCDLDTWKFPFDHQTCPIEFIVNKWDVVITPRFQELILSEYEPDGSWDVIDANISANEGVVTIYITFFRKPTYILVNLVVPITALALLSPMVFLLPNQSGERVGFSITTLLAISVYMTIVSDHVPNKSNPVPLLCSMMFVSYALTAVVVTVVIINARIYRLPDKVAIPRILLRLLSVAKCMCCCFKRRNIKTVETEEEERKSLKDGETSHKVQIVSGDIVTWKDISWAIDMFFMVVLYLVKFSLICVFFIVLNLKDTHGHKT